MQSFLYGSIFITWLIEFELLLLEDSIGLVKVKQTQSIYVEIASHDDGLF